MKFKMNDRERQEKGERRILKEVEMKSDEDEWKKKTRGRDDEVKRGDVDEI